MTIKLAPHEYYQVHDDKDINAIFMEGINIDEQSLPRNVEIIRVKHIRVRGSPVEAMAAMNDLDDI